MLVKRNMTPFSNFKISWINKCISFLTDFTSWCLLFLNEILCNEWIYNTVVLKINFQLPTEIRQLFRKIETKSKQLITNNLHQEFNYIYIYVYIKLFKFELFYFFSKFDEWFSWSWLIVYFKLNNCWTTYNLKLCQDKFRVSLIKYPFVINWNDIKSV